MAQQLIIVNWRANNTWQVYDSQCVFVPLDLPITGRLDQVEIYSQLIVPD